MLQILASFSEFERNTILENIYTGQRQRALEGYYQGNLPLDIITYLIIKRIND